MSGIPSPTGSVAGSPAVVVLVPTPQEPYGTPVRSPRPMDQPLYLQNDQPDGVDPHAVTAHVRELIGPRGVAYVSTPNVLTLAPKGETRSGNPWHVREYRPEEYRALCARHFGSVDLLGLHHARRLRAHQFAIERL